MNYQNVVVYWLHVNKLTRGTYLLWSAFPNEGDLEAHEIPEGFYSKKPWARIKVALAGPIVNLVFSLFAFGLIWGFGGREKTFAEFTKLIGWVDPQSELYANGVRPGDEVTGYNEQPYEGYKDLVYAAIMNGRPVAVEGNKINYYQDTRIPYDYTLKPYESPYFRKGFTTIGIVAPANYLIYDDFSNSDANALYPHSPMANSGIQKNDRLIWVDGELVFSQEQLINIVNSKKMLLTIERGADKFLAKVPRIHVSDMRLKTSDSTEINDWAYEVGLRKKDGDIYFLPYTVDGHLIVEKGAYFVNEASHVTHVSKMAPTSPIDRVLEKGDRIIAVDGTPVSSGPEMLEAMQTRKIQMIVKRNVTLESILWKDEDQAFEADTDWDHVLPIAASIGSHEPIKSKGDLQLLNAVTPIALKDFPFPQDMKSKLDQNLKKQLAEVKKISNPEERANALEQVENYQNRLMLGVQFQDRQVVYNPSPFTLFYSVFQEITRNLIAVVSGYFSPKHFGGPIFIVQVMKNSWSVGFKEALFWLGAISLNLGVLNLLPVPVLDGGHICFSIIEKIRGKPMKAKTMQRLIIPFVVLLIFAFLYLTYHDITRIFGKFF